MPAITAPAAPRTQADIERLVRSGVRDIRHAAVRLGISRRAVEYMVATGEVWSFKLKGKRVIPVSELRRIAAVEAMESMRSKRPGV